MIKYARLGDVFILGPLQIYVSTFITHTPLRYFMLLTGILNIIYNGHNLLLFNKLIKKPVSVFKPFVHLKNGKHQIHRLYNILIMYPIFAYILLTVKLPDIISILFFTDIIVGFLFNLYFFIKHYRERKYNKEL